MLWSLTVVAPLALAGVAVGGVPVEAGDAPLRKASASGANATAATHGRVADLSPLRASDLEEDRPFASGRSAFAVRFRERLLAYRIMGASALPGESVPITVEGSDAQSYRLSYAAGDVVARGTGSWLWRAPEEPGIYALQVFDPGSFEFVHVNVFVLHPSTRVEGGLLNGYRIGSYPARALGGRPEYEPPRGFIEVTPEQEEVLVSPHFTVGQFLCKQPGEPKYLVLTHALVLKLEAILETLDQEGYTAPTLHVMSGYRTPHYHRRVLGRGTSYSRHMYGDAADVFIDVDGNRVMDDLNGDGWAGMSDLRVLAAVVEQVERAGLPGVRPGGMGLYGGRNSGPFVHVDARGERVRW